MDARRGRSCQRTGATAALLRVWVLGFTQKGAKGWAYLGGHTLRVLIAGKMPNEDLDAGA